MVAKIKRSRFSSEQRELAEKQIIEERKTVDYDTTEFTVGYLIQEFRDGNLYIPPYQRKFVWDSNRKAKFIESMILGLPIPFMFVADMPNGKLEIVDGAQRIQTLQQFCDDELTLRNLERLNSVNKFKFSDLPISQQRKLKNRSLRMVMLSDKTDEATRRDLFERINTGSDELKDSELRKGAYAGPLYKLIQDCAADELFLRLCPISQRLRARGEGEELVLRFFAYSDRYQAFQHSVKGFLNMYLKDTGAAFNEDELRARFTTMLKFVEEHFPYGFQKALHYRLTPRVRFEAISVGVYLALQVKPDLVPPAVTSWLESEDFKRHTRTDASNSPAKLKDRVEFVRDALLGASHD